MDTTDRNILALLKENSRSSVRQMGKQLHLPPATVHVRMRKMIKEGIIERFTVRTNDTAVGESLIVFLLIKGNLTLEKELLDMECVKEVFHVTGEHNIHAKLKFADMEKFNEFMNKFRTRYPNVQSTLSMVATGKEKEVV